jgi:hypothetical protein
VESGPGAALEIDVLDAQVGHFLNPRARVVQKKEDRSVPQGVSPR